MANQPNRCGATSSRPAAKIFDAAGDQLLVSLRNGTIQVRAVGTGAVVREIRADTGQRTLAWSRDGRLLATAAQERVTLWDSSGTILRRFAHDFGDVVNLAFSPDGSALASAGLDANVHLWDVATGRRKATVPDQLLANFALRFTADGKNLLIGGVAGAIEIVDVATATIARRLPAQKYAVAHLARYDPQDIQPGNCIQGRAQLMRQRAQELVL